MPRRYVAKKRIIKIKFWFEVNAVHFAPRKLSLTTMYQEGEYQGYTIWHDSFSWCVCNKYGIKSRLKFDTLLDAMCHCDWLIINKAKAKAWKRRKKLLTN